MSEKMIKETIREKNQEVNWEMNEELNLVIKEKYGNTGGILVLKNGETVLENYYNGFTKESTFHIFSVTKSIVSILVGIAIEQGFIKHIDKPVLDFFRIM